MFLLLQFTVTPSVSQFPTQGRATSRWITHSLTVHACALVSACLGSFRGTLCTAPAKTCGSSCGWERKQTPRSCAASRTEEDGSWCPNCHCRTVVRTTHTLDNAEVQQPLQTLSVMSAITKVLRQNIGVGQKWELCWLTASRLQVWFPGLLWLRDIFNNASFYLIETRHIGWTGSFTLIIKWIRLHSCVSKSLI